MREVIGYRYIPGARTWARVVVVDKISDGYAIDVEIRRSGQWACQETFEYEVSDAPRDLIAQGICQALDESRVMESLR